MKQIFTNAVASVLNRKGLLTEAGKYFLVGAACTVLDIGILYLLTHFGHMQPVPASIISFMAGTILNYYLCTIWIFKVRTIANRNLEMTYYLIITGVGLGINSLVIWFITATFGYSVMLSKLLAIFVTYWWNFGARKYFLHSKVSLQAEVARDAA